MRRNQIFRIKFFRQRELLGDAGGMMGVGVFGEMSERDGNGWKWILLKCLDW